MTLSFRDTMRMALRLTRGTPYRGAGMVIIRHGDCDEILLGRRRYGWDRGRWSIPGGGVEHGETFRAAAQRETEEELEQPALAVQLDPADWGPGTLEGLPAVRFRLGPFFHWDTYLLRLAEPRPGWPRRHSHEFAEMRWFPLDGLPARLHPLLPMTLRRLRRHLRRTAGGAGGAAGEEGRLTAARLADRGDRPAERQGPAPGIPPGRADMGIEAESE